MKGLDELAIPADLKYAKDHEWASPKKPHRIGVSDFAQDQLGDITFADLPEPGVTVAAGTEFGSLESIKSVSALFAPVSGKVLAVNQALGDDPGLVNRDPYGEGWLIEVEPADPAEFAALMDAAAYKACLKEDAT